MATSKKLTQQTSLTTTSCVGDSHVRTLVFPENERDYVERDLGCSMTSSGFYEKNNLSLYSLKMLKDCLAATGDGILPKLSLNWKGSGTHVNGKYLTQKITACHRIGKECILSGILEDQVDEKYFLSKKMTRRLMSYKNKQQIALPRDTSEGDPRDRTLLKINSMHKASKK